jgi:hypothetical protein
MKGHLETYKIPWKLIIVIHIIETYLIIIYMLCIIYGFYPIVLFTLDIFINDLCSFQ